MYGIVNKAIEELVKEKFGSQKWEDVKKRSGISIDFFLSNEPYDDAITYQLAGVVAEELNISFGYVFVTFGEYWILKTGKEKYGGLMEAGGHNLKEFLRNLPAFHSRIMLIYPKLTPPEFQVSDETENSIHVHYFSKREGLQDFVFGLLSGLGKMYNTPVEIKLLHSRNEGAKHETFKFIWS